MAKKDELISPVEVVPVRKAFPKEAGHFTPWLAEHIDALGDRLGVKLVLEQREKSVGDFNVDLLCADGNGRPVIIENQLERTSHDHLGKLLTYLVNLEASMAIWVTTDPRNEHQKVIEWLNENTPHDISFYLVKIEALRIGTSPFAPYFSVLARPDEQAKEVGEKKKEWADRHFKRLEFWKGLLKKSKEKTKLHSGLSPSRYHWIGTGAGKSGVGFNYEILNDSGVVELYIDHDKESAKGNKAIFDALRLHKRTIEKEFGSALSWERLDEKRACRIAKRFTIGGLADPESWSGLQDKMIAAMIKLERALRPQLDKIKV